MESTLAVFCFLRGLVHTRPASPLFSAFLTIGSLTVFSSDWRHHARLTMPGDPTSATIDCPVTDLFSKLSLREGVNNMKRESVPSLDIGCTLLLRGFVHMKPAAPRFSACLIKVSVTVLSSDWRHHARLAMPGDPNSGAIDLSEISSQTSAGGLA